MSLSDAKRKLERVDAILSAVQRQLADKGMKVTVEVLDDAIENVRSSAADVVGHSCEDKAGRQRAYQTGYEVGVQDGLSRAESYKRS